MKVPIGKNTRVYVTKSGKAGFVYREGKNLVHAGVNRRGTFVRAEHKLSRDAKVYAYVKPYDAGGGATAKVARHIHGRVGFDSTGPFAEGAVGRLKIKKRFR